MKIDYEQAIEIAAPADVVWAVMSDVERWPQWTASVHRAQLLEDGGLRPGQRARIRQPRLPVAIWTVDEVEHGRTFTWSSPATGLHSDAEHTVEPAGAGTSRAYLRLTHDGALAGPARAVYGRLIRRYLRFEAEGFKQAAESRSADPPG